MDAAAKLIGGNPWAVILAGGDGTRLRSMTRQIAGDERPKQFCPVLGSETLFDQTCHRVSTLIPPERTLSVVTRAHERFYAPLLATVPPERVVVQPGNRGTAPAILYALLRLAALAPLDPVAIFPSDHYVSDDERFMAHVRAAFGAVRSRPDLAIILGITPDGPEAAYGWIEPAEGIPAGAGGELFRVRRFWEKPSPALARALWARGYLWNSFVLVAAGPTFLTLVRNGLPRIYALFAAIRPALGTVTEDEAVRTLYARLPAANFSRDVLEACPSNLAVLPVRGVEWSDVGEPRRALAILARAGVRPTRAARAAPTPESA